MAAEVVSRCCNAPVHGIVAATVCDKCGSYCRTHLLWNELPPVGTFEKPLGQATRLEDTYGS